MTHPQSPSTNRKTVCSSKQTVSNSQRPSPVILEPFTEVNNAFVTVKPVITRLCSRLLSLTIKLCPYCGGSHVRGGGKGAQALLGHRASHCLSDDNTGYVLVNAEGGAI